ncbi:MAG: toxin-antitoxin system, antitoxin component, Xre family protein [Bacteroides sp.]
MDKNTYTNSELLRYCTARAGLSPTELARRIGITYGALKKKTQGISEFKAGEMIAIQHELGLSNDEAISIFLKGVPTKQA